jgi:hypothetical protein
MLLYDVTNLIQNGENVLKLNKEFQNQWKHILLIGGLDWLI